MTYQLCASSNSCVTVASFQHQDFKHLRFPAQLFVDYVRVYQRSDVKDGTTCDPKSHPTADYIQKSVISSIVHTAILIFYSVRHLNAYSNPNFTTWAQAGYEFPKNSGFDGC